MVAYYGRTSKENNVGNDIGGMVARFRLRNRFNGSMV